MCIDQYKYLYKAVKNMFLSFSASNLQTCSAVPAAALIVDLTHPHVNRAKEYLVLVTFALGGAVSLIHAVP